MFKKKYRLRKNTAFNATFRLKTCKSNDFVVLYKGKSKEHANIPVRVGIVVSKKIHKRAVKRNKIKRRLREIYIEAVKAGYTEGLSDALSIVFIARSKILDIDFLTLKNSIFELLREFK